MTIYYVDSRNGSDQASGTSSGKAWQSVDKVNRADLKPGDTVLFRAGDVYREGLEITDSGTASAPITFGAWGSGPAPVFSGAVDVVDQTWTKTGDNVWSTALAKTGWFPPEKLQIDGETANVRAAGPAAVDEAGDWAWSSGTLYVYSEGHPASAHASIEAAMGNYGILVNEADHVRLVRLAADMANQGIIVRDSTGSELIKVEASDNARNGINLKGSDDTLIEGGSSHDNGIEGLGTSTKHLGHGLLITNGSQNNVVRDMALTDNAEDGVQFGNDAGDGNRIEGNRITGNQEDGVDIKQGSQTLAGNLIEGNVFHGVLLHEGSDLTTLADNTIRTVGPGNALMLSEGARVASSGNDYGAEDSYTVRLQTSAGDGSTFSNDTFIDGGAISGVNVLLSGGRNHRFDQSTFVMRENGYALQVKLAASGTIVSDSIFYGQGLVQMDNGTGLQLDGNLYWGTGRTDAWARVDGPRRLFGKDYLLTRDSDGIAADPRFADPANDDFSLLATSPVPELGAQPLAGGIAEPAPQPEPEPEPAPEPGSVAEDAPAGWEEALAVVGSDVADTIEGTSQAEWISGLGGSDVLKGKGGSDALFGGDGADTLMGASGDDLLAGGAGDDVMNGDSGSDTAWYGDAAGPVKVDLKVSGAQATGHGQDSLKGVENLVGSGHGDRLLGTGGDNILDGGAGDDILTGRWGADTLVGGTGDDRLLGGGGADIFVFAPGDGRDTIGDFKVEDRIQLDSPGLGSFADVLGRASDSAAGVVIDLGDGDALILEGVHIDDMAAGHFLF